MLHSATGSDVEGKMKLQRGIKLFSLSWKVRFINRGSPHSSGLLKVSCISFCTNMEMEVPASLSNKTRKSSREETDI